MLLHPIQLPYWSTLQGPHSKHFAWNPSGGIGPFQKGKANPPLGLPNLVAHWLHQFHHHQIGGWSFSTFSAALPSLLFR